MEFAVLGPLRVTADDTVIEVPGARLRALLALLLLRANQTVPGDQLADAVWDGRPSAANREALPTYVMRLRRALGPEVGARIVTRPGGYAVEIEDSELDLNRFRTLCDEARELADAGHGEAAYGRLDAALTLWRGELLADVTSGDVFGHDVDEILAAKLGAHHLRIEVGLRLGRHTQLLPGIAAVVRANPLDEQLRGRWMLALYRSGRQGEALEVYQQARRILAEELGVDPSPPLKELYRQILKADPALAAPEEPEAPAAAAESASPEPVRAVPRQLPATVRHFTGRERQIAALESLVADAFPDDAEGCGDGGAGGGTAASDPHPAQAAAADGGAVVIVAITGMAGVGKTSLAVLFAHRVAERFPDGQLYANLRGFEPTGDPADVETVVRSFLEALDVPSSGVPSDLDAQLSLYRSRLAGTRTLIVLDNARDAEQIRPLLPGSAGCLVLVTSRRQLPGLVALDGAAPLCLDVLTADESLALLRHRLRAAGPNAALDELARLCAGLPLALNIAAARAATDTPLDTLLADLRDARGRLDLLSTGETASDVRAVLSWSYLALDAAPARLFRLLGLNPSPDISVGAARALTGDDDLRARLATLVEAGLLERSRPLHYRSHDLVRLYAAELAAREPRDDRIAAVTRLTTWYLHTAHAAIRAMATNDAPLELTEPAGVDPLAFDSYDQALTWFDEERVNLMAGVALAAEHGLHEIAWKLAVVQRMYFLLRYRLTDWLRTYEVALASARTLGDKAAEARVHNGLGTACLRLSRLRDAETHYRRVIALRRELGDRRGQGVGMTNLASLFNNEGRHEEAIELLERAIQFLPESGDVVNHGIVLLNLGVSQERSGRPREAMATYQRALPIIRAAGNRYTEAIILGNLGTVHQAVGELDRALEVFRAGLALRRELGDERLQANSLLDIGDVLESLGQAEDARKAWADSLALYERVGHAAAADVRKRLAAS